MGRAEPGLVGLMPSEMRPDTAWNKNGSSRAGPKTKSGHDLVAIKRIMPDRQLDGPYHVESAYSSDRLSYIYFFINFIFLITKLFNIIKFELKIYDFTLNNVIKLFYLIFCRVVPD
jgi:hypothetical protein